MGKTSLLGYAADSAAGFRVVSVAGVESELEFGYAGLHRLLVSFLPAMAGLPQRQRNALGCAFGLIDGRPADRFAVALATLSLLADAAADSPLLCVVDDAQWLDQESLGILAMVGRRLNAERIALVLGTRDAEHGRVRPEGRPDLRGGGASELGSRPAGADPAQAEGVMVMYPETRCRHPLIRSAVYGGASPAGRRRAHEALAAELDPQRDADRRAWHLAAAASGPDEAVAAELDRAADRAQARGGYSAAGALLARAAQLTRDEDRWAERVLAAAHAHLAGGAPARARLLLEHTAEISDPLQQARMRRLQGLIRYALGQAPGTASILVDAACALEPLDPYLARATTREALEAARVTGRLSAAGESDLAVCPAAPAMPPPPGSQPGVAELLLDGAAALVLDGHRAAVPVLRRSIAGLLDDQPGPAEAPLWHAIAGWAAGAVGDDTSLHELATRLDHNAREEGALAALSTAL